MYDAEKLYDGDDELETQASPKQREDGDLKRD